jgi:hypothetical protein
MVRSSISTKDLTGSATQSSFIYTTLICSPVDAIHRAWGKTVSYGERYEHVRGGNHYIFSVPPNRAWTEEEKEAGSLFAQ